MLWPLPRWDARRAATNFSTFMLLFITFAIAIVELYINTTSEDVYLIIFLSVAGLCAVLGVVSSLLAWARVRRLRANPAPVSR